MIVDHLCLTFGGPDLLRDTVGRLAVPLFFVLSGYLVTRLSWRHAWVAGIGLALPAVVPWIDSPNVLLWYVVGAVVVWGLRDSRPSMLVAVVIVLAAGANGWLTLWGRGYNPAALVALMLVGQLLRSSTLADPWHGWGRLPAWLRLVGRYPLSVYVGHLLVLQVVWSLGYWRV